MDWYWFALAERETIDHERRVCHRSCFQRVFEVDRLAQRMRLTLAENQVAASRVELEYSPICQTW
eukprot:8821747-Prorocentrum_lima.AAC.1